MSDLREKVAYRIDRYVQGATATETLDGIVGLLDRPITILREPLDRMARTETIDGVVYCPNCGRTLEQCSLHPTPEGEKEPCWSALARAAIRDAGLGPAKPGAPL